MYAGVRRLRGETGPDVERWTRLVLRHRWLVLAAWAVVFLVALVASSRLSELLTNRFTLPGTDTERAEQILQDHFGQRSTGSFTLVVQALDGDAEALVPAVKAAAERATAKLPTGRLVSVQALSGSVVAAQIVSDLEPVDAKGHTDRMRAAVGSIPGATTYLTGQAATEHDLDPVFSEDLKKGELYLAIPIALVILVFTFGTLSFLLPFAFALRDDSDHARDHLDRRELHGADDVPHEPRVADRARDRDRLLAADGLPLPRGVAEGRRRRATRS